MCALILAAGYGRRFHTQAAQDKLLVPLGSGENPPALVQCTMACAFGRVEQAVILARRSNVALINLLEGLILPERWRVHAVSDGGLGDSLAEGARQAEPQRGYLVMLGDMPFVRADTLQRLAAAIEPDRLVVPVYRGQPGHPRGIGTAHRQALLSASGERGARDLFGSAALTLIEVDDPGVLQDVDVPADLRRGGTIPGTGESYA